MVKVVVKLLWTMSFVLEQKQTLDNVHLMDLVITIVATMKMQELDVNQVSFQIIIVVYLVYLSGKFVLFPSHGVFSSLLAIIFVILTFTKKYSSLITEQPNLAKIINEVSRFKNVYNDYNACQSIWPTRLNTET